MNKKLKIQFWKAEKALAMQILEQEGLPKEKGDGFIKITDYPSLGFETGACLRGCQHYADFELDSLYFVTNAKRDAYLKKIVNAITDELFMREGELKIGEICEVSDDNKDWQRRTLLAVLPKSYFGRYIASGKYSDSKWSSWKYAHPITKRTEPTIEECGQLVTYTWCDNISENN